jgi:hypothetical protein
MEENCIAYSSVRAGLPTNHGWSPCSNKRFSFLQSLQTVSGAHPASYQLDTGALALPLVRELRMGGATFPLPYLIMIYDMIYFINCSWVATRW